MNFRKYFSKNYKRWEDAEKRYPGITKGMSEEDKCRLPGPCSFHIEHYLAQQEENNE